MMKNSPVEIESRDFWFKVVDMLQQNCALIDPKAAGGVVVYFVHDGSGVFDQIEFDSLEMAIGGLLKNGFIRYVDDKQSQKFIAPPKGPFFRDCHPNGPIYSSNRFWKF